MPPFLICSGLQSVAKHGQSVVLGILSFELCALLERVSHVVTKHQVQSTKYKAPSTKHQVQSTKYKAPSSPPHTDHCSLHCRDERALTMLVDCKHIRSNHCQRLAWF